MTSIAALQCVERGVLGLDDDVSGILHEFRDLEVLSGFDGEGRPVLRRAEGRVTLRFVDLDFFFFLPLGYFLFLQDPPPPPPPPAPQIQGTGGQAALFSKALNEKKTDIS